MFRFCFLDVLGFILQIKLICHIHAKLRHVVLAGVALALAVQRRRADRGLGGGLGISLRLIIKLFSVR